MASSVTDNEVDTAAALHLQNVLDSLRHLLQVVYLFKVKHNTFHARASDYSQSPSGGGLLANTARASAAACPACCQHPPPPDGRCIQGLHLC